MAPAIVGTSDTAAATELRLGSEVLAELDRVFGPDGLAGERYDAQHMHGVAR